MFLDVISLLVGFLCLFVVLVILFNQKPNRITNGYLITILIVVGLQRFLYGIEALDFSTNTYSPLHIKPLLAFYIVPVYYLFFVRLINGVGVIKKELLHFIFPSVLMVVNLVFASYTINRLLYLFYSVGYFVLILDMIKKFLYRKNLSLLDKISYPSMKKWIILMLILTFLLIVYSNCISFQDLSSRMDLSTFYRYSSFVWLGLVLYMFKNPVIIFGEQTFLKNIQSNEHQDFQIWHHKPLRLIEEKDKVVYQTISKRIEAIILEIKILQKSDVTLSKTTLNTESLARALKVPKRHLDFIFKYYCHYSVNDFSNLIKVNYALFLINEGYLEKYTVASLGEKCLFNSRFTFSKNFKKFVGVSVSDYVGHMVIGVDAQNLDHLIQRNGTINSATV
ncbi:Helix-turn-helix domain protein [compost metagenome]